MFHDNKKAFRVLYGILKSPISHPHKKEHFDQRGEQRQFHHHLHNIGHVGSTWALALLVGVHSFLGTSSFLETYAGSVSTSSNQSTSPTRVTGNTQSSGATNNPYYFASLLAKKNIISLRTSEGEYRIQDTITRAELSKIAVKGSQITITPCTSTSTLFQDTKNIGDICSYIETLARNNIVSRTSAYFRPNDSITRAELVKILVKSTQSNTSTNNNATNTSNNTTSLGVTPYTDISNIGDLRSYVEIAYHKGCLSRTSSNFRPNATATRGEAFKLVSCLSGIQENPRVTNNTTNTQSTKPNVTNTKPNTTLDPSTKDTLTSAPKESTTTSNTIMTDTQGTPTTTNTPIYSGGGGGGSGGGGSTSGGSTPPTGNSNTKSATNTVNNSSSGSISNSGSNNAGSGTSGIPVSPTYTYSWSTGSYGTCSISCGGGTQTRSVTCMRNDGVSVSDSFCTTTKPTTTQSCNTQACSVPVNGSCNTTINICTTGTPSNSTPGSCGGTATWSCLGSNGGTTANCSKQNAACAINGSCGTSNTTTVSTFPTGTLACTSGSQTTLDSTATDGIYNWSCVGSNGGGTTSCSASKSVIQTSFTLNTPGSIGTFTIRNTSTQGEDSNTPTSLAFLNDHIAGSLGQIRNIGGHLFAGSKRIRIYGTNMSAGSYMPPKADTDKIIPNLAKQGFNGIRAMGFERLLATPNTYTVTYKQQGPLNTDGTFNATAIDNFDYFVHKAEQAGIYLQFALSSYRDNYRIAGFSDCLNICRGVDMYLPELIQKQKDFALMFLTRTNPYSGRTYASDPGVVAIEINNENGLHHTWSQGTFDTYSASGALKTKYVLPLEIRWENWLQAKYGPISALKTAWGTTLQDGVALNGFSDLSIPSKSTFSTQSVVFRRDWYQFMGEIEKAYLDTMYTYLKNTVGVTSLIYGTQQGYMPHWAQTGMDVNDIHDYMGKEAVNKKDASGNIIYHTNGRPLQVADMWSMLSISKPVSSDTIGPWGEKNPTKPNFITEFAYYNGNQYMAEMDPVLLSYAGFQDIDALYMFNYHGMNDYRVPNTYPGYYGTTVNSITRVPAVLAYRRGDFTPGEKYIATQTKESYLDAQANNSVVTAGNFHFGGQIRSRITHNTYLNLVDAGTLSAVKVGCSSDACQFNTTTNEIQWTLGNSIISNTPKTKMAVGFYNNSVVDFGNGINLQIGDTMSDYAVVGVSALDNIDLSSSQKILISLAGYYEEPGQYPRIPGQADFSWGNDAQKIESIPSIVRFPSTGSVTVSALDSTGMIKGNVPFIQKDGYIEILTGPSFDTGWYLIEKY